MTLTCACPNAAGSGRLAPEPGSNQSSNDLNANRQARLRIGVLALQGAFARHVASLNRCGVEAFEVRDAAQLADCDALVLPGGESTTMSMLLDRSDLRAPLAARLSDGLPVFGTCAGMILLAETIADGRPDQMPLRAIDIDVRRNGYGRQLDSFEADIDVAGLDDGPFRAVFIRAPVVTRVGPDVNILAEVEGDAVMCSSGNVVVASFHPELTDDDRLHRLFLQSLLG